MGKLVYYTAGHSGRHALETTWGLDDEGLTDELEEMAGEAAADYHGNHDGWEAQWPLTVTLYASTTGPAIAAFTVEREYEPHFFATLSHPTATEQKE